MTCTFQGKRISVSVLSGNKNKENNTMLEVD